MSVRKMFTLVHVRNEQRSVRGTAESVNAVLSLLVVSVLIHAGSAFCFAQADPASEPAVFGVGKVFAAGGENNNDGRLSCTGGGPFQGFLSQFFRSNRAQPRQV